MSTALVVVSDSHDLGFVLDDSSLLGDGMVSTGAYTPRRHDVPLCVNTRMASTGEPHHRQHPPRPAGMVGRRRHCSSDHAVWIIVGSRGEEVAGQVLTDMRAGNIPSYDGSPVSLAAHIAHDQHHA